ncbi:MAG TPA: phage portal protein [Xanthobacteraceae bacterium]|nr:phage portal protein [Xanthobacteraceae bacterium]
MRPTILDIFRRAGAAITAFNSTAPSPGTTRGYEGAASGRRWFGTKSMPNPRAEQIGARATLANRARGLVANNPFAASGVDAWVSALVASGIRPQATYPDDGVRATLNASFEEWTDRADADELGDFYALQALAVRRVVTDGESFMVLINDPAGLRIRLLDPEQIDPSIHRELPGGGRVVAGIEFAADGRRVAYHVLPERQGVAFNYPATAVRIPADDVIHLFRVDMPGQVRGVSWLAPILLRLADYDAAIDAQLVRQKVATLVAGFITSTPQDGLLSGDQNTGEFDSTMEPGALIRLPPGTSVTFSDPAKIGAEVIDFLKVTAREIAAGLGVPYEAMTGDLTSVNYSSIRAGMVAWRRRVETIQHNTIAFQMLRPIWQRWATIEILSGRIVGEVAPALGARWITPKQEWVDPSKDVEAEVAAIAAGLTSRRQMVAARGIDIEALDAEIAADRARETSLNLSFGAAAAPKPKGAADAANPDT